MGVEGGHWSFVIASYAVTTVVLVGLVVSIVLDLRRQRRLLESLEASGGRRRRASEPASGETAA